MENEIVVNGERYRKVEAEGEIKIVVLERGFVYVGRYSEQDGECTISGARALIRWGTSAHLGQLAGGPLKDTKLGAACVVKARLAQVIHTLEVQQDAWKQHVN